MNTALIICLIAGGVFFAASVAKQESAPKALPAIAKLALVVFGVALAAWFIGK